MQQRLRHTSMPQARATVPSTNHQVGPNSIHHPLEPSLSHAEVRSFNPFSQRTHATISSNSAASMDSMDSAFNGRGAPPINIPGKLLSLRLKKGQIDKAVKDKSSKTFPENFSVTLFLLKPEDQSDQLIDYSLYTKVLSQENQLNTITAANMCGKTEKQFTVVPVSERSEPTKPRVRPLTGGSGASSSSATPSLKSVEQSSQDSGEEASEASDDDLKLASPRGDFISGQNGNPKCNNLKKRPTMRPQSNWV